MTISVKVLSSVVKHLFLIFGCECSFQRQCEDVCRSLTVKSKSHGPYRLFYEHVLISTVNFYTILAGAQKNGINCKLCACVLPGV